MRISVWSSDVCSSDLPFADQRVLARREQRAAGFVEQRTYTICAPRLGEQALLARGEIDRDEVRLIAGPAIEHQQRISTIEPEDFGIAQRGERDRHELARPGGVEAEIGRRAVGMAAAGPTDRSEAGRVGEEGASTCRLRWSPYH